MVMHGVESGLKSAVVVNGRKLGGGRRDGRASFSMVSADLAHSFCMRLGNAAGRTVHAIRLSYAAAEASDKSYGARRKNGREVTRTGVWAAFLGALPRRTGAVNCRAEGFYTGWGGDRKRDVSGGCE